jgi:hypothetical protein
LSRLRQLLIGAGVVALLFAGWAWIGGAHHAAGMAVLAVYAAVLLLSLAIERARYKKILHAPPAGSWRETEERFVDPESGKLVAVWEEPATGRRAYVEARS